MFCCCFVVDLLMWLFVAYVRLCQSPLAVLFGTTGVISRVGGKWGGGGVIMPVMSTSFRYGR